MRIIFLTGLVFLMILSPILAFADITAEQLARQIYDRDIGHDMKLKGIMQLISKKGHVRTRQFISMRKDTKGQRKLLIRFTAPADIDGTGFLTLEKNNSHKTEQHLYLPALKRTRRIVASQKGRSFVNSDFTYEDMQRHPVDEWTYQLKGDEKILGEDCYTLISIPRKDTETQYSKIVSWVEKTHLIPLKSEFWNKKKHQSKVYIVNKYKVIDNIATETDVIMKDLKSGHKTRLISKNIVYNSGLKDSLFTTRSLER